MHADQYDAVPDLALLAGQYWITDPKLSCLATGGSTHEIEGLRLYAHIVWPTSEMHDRRCTFLARCGLQLKEKNQDTAADVEFGRDGIPRSPPPFVAEVVRIYRHASELSVTHLLSPSGGWNSALQKGRAEIAKDIDSHLVKIRTAVCLADFILRYLVHVPNGRKPASINKGASFIADSGYGDVGFSVIRNRSDIIQAWSQAKSTIIFSLAAFYSEPVFLTNVLESADPADLLDQIWRDDLRRRLFLA